MLAAILLAVIAGPPSPPAPAAPPPILENNTIEGEVNKLVEMRVGDVKPPEGFELGQFEWLILDPRVSWRQYESGKVLVATAPVGEYEARLRIAYVNWEDKKQASEWRVFTIKIRGPPGPVDPVVPDPDPPGPRPDPTPPADLTGPVYSIVIRKATELTAQQSTALLSIRSWVDSQSQGKFQHLEFNPEAVNGDGSANASVRGYVAKIPAGAKMPFVFVIQKRKTGGSEIHWSGELLSAEQVIDSLKEYSR